MESSKSLQDQFFAWLSKKISPAQLSEIYITYADIESFCLQKKILTEKLFETTEIDTIKNLMGLISSSKEFRQHYKRNVSKINSAIQYYYLFLIEHFNYDTKSETSSQDKKAATDIDDVKSNRKAFISWLNSNDVTGAEVFKYLNAVKECEKAARELEIIDDDLFLISNVQKLTKIKDILFDDIEFKKLNERQNNKLLLAFNKLIDFRLNSINKIKSEEHQKITQEGIKKQSSVKTKWRSADSNTNLLINNEKLKQLITVFQEEIDLNGYITDFKMMKLLKDKCPSIAESIEDLTTHDVRKGLSHILQDYFAFKGPIISPFGVKLSIKDIYSEFAREHDKMSLEELKAFSAELNNGMIHWPSILKEMIRVSQNQFIRKDLINFDVNAIDKILDKICPDDYIPIKDINTFSNFPKIGYPWNGYILESYIFNFSRKFKLTSPSFKEDTICTSMTRVD